MAKKKKSANKKEDADLEKFKRLIDGIIEAKLKSLVQQAVSLTISEIEKKQPKSKFEHNPIAI